MAIHYPLTIYFDGSCHLCRSEIENLAARDTAGQLIMVDCSPPGFDLTGIPATRDELMRLIHARDAHGAWINGVDVFVAAYRAAQLPWVARVLEHPRIKPHAQAAYPWVVRNRYRISSLGLHKVLNLLTRRAQARRQQLAQQSLARTQACHDHTCDANTPRDAS
jgi:predicted DCC family thiol-disulfide oxidoreductase YuxK